VKTGGIRCHTEGQAVTTTRTIRRHLWCNPLWIAAPCTSCRSTFSLQIDQAEASFTWPYRRTQRPAQARTSWNNTWRSVSRPLVIKDAVSCVVTPSNTALVSMELL